MAANAHHCECEHERHFSGNTKGLQGHDYYASVVKTVEVITPYGTFHVCEECQKGCTGYHQLKEA
jgi:hypothetical protein